MNVVSFYRWMMILFIVPMNFAYLDGKSIDRRRTLTIATDGHLGSLTPSMVRQKLLFERNKFKDRARFQPWNMHDALIKLSIQKQALRVPQQGTDEKTNDQFDHGFVIIDRNFNDQHEGEQFLNTIIEQKRWPTSIISRARVDHQILTYFVVENKSHLNAKNVTDVIGHHQQWLEHQFDLHIVDLGLGHPRWDNQFSSEHRYGSSLTITAVTIFFVLVFIICIRLLLSIIKRDEHLKNKSLDFMENSNQLTTTTRLDKRSTKKISFDIPMNISQPEENLEETQPICKIDIPTGHSILSDVRDHLTHRDRLESEWKMLCNAERNPQQRSYSIALSDGNLKKNRYEDCVPYDQTRVQLLDGDDDGDDYINATPISDSGPKCKYIATQGPMVNTSDAFWQMVWEQGASVIVALARPIENGQTMCHHYWPVEGSVRFRDFEINFVSERIGSSDYLVRSFYLRNLQTMQTRTVSQFHFLTWEQFQNPPSVKSVLDFRRKVNKSFRDGLAPIIVHCNDGVGRTGIYILLDMILNSIEKGAREINIVETLEHLRDQRAKMVPTKEQFQFVFMAIAEQMEELIQMSRS